MTNNCNNDYQFQALCSTYCSPYSATQVYIDNQFSWHISGLLTSFIKSVEVWAVRSILDL